MFRPASTRSGACWDVAAWKYLCAVRPEGTNKCHVRLDSVSCDDPILEDCSSHCEAKLTRQELVPAFTLSRKARTHGALERIVADSRSISNVVPELVAEPSSRSHGNTNSKKNGDAREASS